MSDLEQKATHIIGYLSHQLGSGWEALQTAIYINAAETRKDINCAQGFFGTCKYACFEQAILSLARITDIHRDAIGMKYLLNFAEQNPSAFTHISQQELLQLIKQHRVALGKISQLLEDIKTQRDHTLAHLDKTLLEAPGSLLAYLPLKYMDVENLFNLLFEILNSFSVPESQSAENYYKQMSQNIRDDLNYLIGLIKTEYHGY